MTAIIRELNFFFFYIFLWFIYRFWKDSSEHCPETRIQMAIQHRKNQTADEKKEEPKPVRKLFADSGRPYNLNEPKIDFTFNDNADHFALDLHVYK